MNWYKQSQVNPYAIRILNMLQNSMQPVDIVYDLGLQNFAMDSETVRQVEDGLQQALILYQQNGGFIGDQEQEIIRMLRDMMYGNIPEEKLKLDIPYNDLGFME